MVDDVRAGFRLARDCSWSVVGVQPDLSAAGASASPTATRSRRCSARTRRARAPQQIFVTGSFWFAATPMAAGCRDAAAHPRGRLSGAHGRVGAAPARQVCSSRRPRTASRCARPGRCRCRMILFEEDPDFRLGYCLGGRGAEARRLPAPLPQHVLLRRRTARMTSRRALEATDDAFAALRNREPTLGPVEKLAAFAEMR